jgi:TonB family protein
MRLLPLMLWIFASLHFPFATPPAQDICVIHWKSVEYNEVARVARFQGDVHLQVSIDKNGRVSKAVVTQSDAGGILRDEALENVTEWTFNPGEERILEVAYEFRLVMPEIYYTPPTRFTADFPNRIHIETNFKPIS